MRNQSTTETVGDKLLRDLVGATPIIAQFDNPMPQEDGKVVSEAWIAAPSTNKLYFVDLPPLGNRVIPKR